MLLGSVVSNSEQILQFRPNQLVWSFENFYLNKIFNIILSWYDISLDFFILVNIHIEQ